MQKRLLLFGVGFGIFLLFVLFSYLTHKDFFTQFDFNTTVRLQDKIPRRLDDIFSMFSFVGSFQVVIVFLLVLLVIHRKLRGIIALLFFAGFHLLELYGKTFVDHPPPPQFMVRTHTLVDFPQFYVRSEFSYPSGHAARAAFVSVIIALILMYSKRLTPTHKLIIMGLVLCYDLFMVTSRVYLGEHWSSDVIGGLLLGSSTALMSGLVF